MKEMTGIYVRRPGPVSFSEFWRRQTVLLVTLDDPKSLVLIVDRFLMNFHCLVSKILGDKKSSALSDHLRSDHDIYSVYGIQYTVVC